MKIRLINRLKKIQGSVMPFPAADLANSAVAGPVEARMVGRFPLDFMKRSRLVTAISCALCLEMALLWGGAYRPAAFPGIAAEYSTFKAVKVGMIMKMYRCHDERIYQAIMDSFDPILVATVIGIESEYQVDAVSPKGCRGLMQLTPNKLADWKNPVANIRVGAAYLESLVKRFGRTDWAVAAYNAGPGAILKYGGVPPFVETRRHVAKALLIGLKSCWPLNNPLISGYHFGLSG